MSTIERTNYPRFPKRRKMNKYELEQGYSLSNEDLAFVHAKAKTDISKFNLATQLKSFQALGYFVGVNKIPDDAPTPEDKIITEQHLSELLRYIKQLKIFIKRVKYNPCCFIVYL